VLSESGHIAAIFHHFTPIVICCRQNQSKVLKEIAYERIGEGLLAGGETMWSLAGSRAAADHTVLKQASMELALRCGLVP
jgi:hypothetical protein